MTNLVQRLVMRLFGKKEELKPEKIRLTVKNGRLVKVYYPACIVGNHAKHAMAACIVGNHAKHAMARQQVTCYEIKLNGNPLLRGLGA